MISHYPEQSDIILTNVLYQHGCASCNAFESLLVLYTHSAKRFFKLVDAMSATPLCRLSRDGQDVGAAARNIESSDDDGYVKLRNDIKAELLRSQESALAELTYAASVGNIEQVELLLARGLPINAGVPVGATHPLVQTHVWRGVESQPRIQKATN